MPTPDAGMGDAGMDGGIVRTREDVPPEEAFTAGVAEVRIPAPVGIGTMGFAPFAADPSVTPFANMFPGTVRAYGVLTFRAVAMSRGSAHQVVLVRMDTIGVFQQLREAVLDEMATRGHDDLGEGLVLAGNHTHSGPGRILMASGALEALGDTFFPEFYDRVVGAIADVVEAALDDRAPAELGYTIAESTEGHNDRRCENNPLPIPQEVPDMPLIAIRREGQIDAIIASYAYHGTVIGIDELTLSGDMGSIVEQKIGERFDHPVSVLFFNSWGGDMSPGDGPVDATIPAAEQPGGYERMHALGGVIADVVVPAVNGLTFTSDPRMRARTYRVRLDREVIGYDDSTFRYPNGGAFCGVGGDGNCEMVARVEGLDRACIRIPSTAGLPKQTMFTAGQIGDLRFVTAPGEWTTALAARVLDAMRAHSGGDAMMIGYANDYTGYSTPEDDWWQGGYEASGALWGPGQGDYLAARAIESFETFADEWNEPPFREPARVEPFGGYTYDAYVPENAMGVGTITADVAATATVTDVVTMTVNGSDPWLGVPTATLERDNAGTFEVVTRTSGLPVDSRSYDFWIDLAPTPTYAEMIRADRTFAWTVSFPIGRRTTTDIPPLAGIYRLRVEIPTADGSMTVTSSNFTIE
jgi:hypothetical protein